MILFDLCCENEHVFEAWFASSLEYEKQKKNKLISCPICNSTKVKKALMAPKLKGTKKNDKTTRQNVLNDKTVIEKFKKLKKFIEKNTEDVGKNFTRKLEKFIMERQILSLSEGKQQESRQTSF